MTSRKVSWGCFVSSAWQSWPKLNLSPSLIKLLKLWFFILFPENWNSLVRVFFIFVRIVCWKHSWWHYVLHLTSYISVCFVKTFVPWCKNLTHWKRPWCCKRLRGTPLQYSCLESPMDGGAWWAAIHGVAKSRTWLSDWSDLIWLIRDSGLM